jgi:hypothetical protein
MGSLVALEGVNGCHHVALVYKVTLCTPVAPVHRSCIQYLYPVHLEVQGNVAWLSIIAEALEHCVKDLWVFS